MSRWNLAWLLGLPALVVTGVVVTANAPPPARDYRLVRTVVDVLAEVDKNYVHELTDAEKQKLVENMINGGLEKLDPHSQYFSADEFKQFEVANEGQFGGIGVVLVADPKTGFLKVESPLPGTPAYDAGIQSNDLILKVGGQSTEGLKVDEARALIKGPAGTPLALTVRHDGTQRDEELSLTRAVIELHPVMGVSRRPDDPAKWDFLADKTAGIAHIRLLGFTEKTDKEVRAAVEDAERAGARALVFDLRDNPGGLLDQAVRVADLFLTDGTIVGTKDRNDRRRTWTAKADGTVFEPAARRPMAVLINRNSASASEIVAGALQDHKRAAIVGERSYGKGSVQKVYPLGPPGQPTGAVKLTAEEWLTPNGKNIHRRPESKETDEWGIRPDPGFEVKLTDDDRRQYLLHMRQLEQVKGKPAGGPPAPAPAAGPVYKDPVLDKAVDYLRGKLQEVGGDPA